MVALRLAALGAVQILVLAGCGTEVTNLPPKAQPLAAPEPAATAPVRPVTTSTGSTPTSAGPRDVVIFDPHNTDSPRVKLLVGPNRLAPAMQKSILDRVLGGRYLTDSKQCPTEAKDHLAEARAAGQFVPSLSEMAIGAFTAPQAKQALYLITNGECGATHAQNWGTATLAVVDRNGMVASAVIAGGSSIHGVVDIDDDGVDEFILTSGFTNQGSMVESASLARFDSGKLVTVKDFGQVMESNCGGGIGLQTETYLVVHAVVKPRTRPEFVPEKRSGPCR